MDQSLIGTYSPLLRRAITTADVSTGMSQDEFKQAQIRAFDTHAPMVGNPPADPRRAQLIALFDMSDERGQALLLAIAGIHAARYPRN